MLLLLFLWLRYNHPMSSRLLAQIDLQNAVKLNENRAVGEVFDTPASLINLLVPNLFILAGVIFLFLLILGGFSIITSGSSKGVEDGQKQITTALIGFVIMFSAYWIIQIVEFLTGVPILNSTR